MGAGLFDFIISEQLRIIIVLPCDIRVSYFDRRTLSITGWGTAQSEAARRSPVRVHAVVLPDSF